MRRIFIWLIIVLFVFLTSCNDEVSINAPTYDDVYVLNCIVRNDSPIQYAIISKNVYTDNGASPKEQDLNQNILGADVILLFNNDTYVMKDTTILVAEGGISNSINCYYAKNVDLSPGKAASIKATLPDGTLLESSIQLPEISLTKLSLDFPQIFQYGYRSIPFYSWSWTGITEEARTILNIPQLEICYTKYNGSIYVNEKKLVPLAKYFVQDENGTQTPKEVEFSFDNYCLTTLDIVNETMKEISYNDPEKHNYIINKVLFSVISLDYQLSKFYSAHATYSEDFTIKLRQTDYTNIKGGKGIFGAYYKFSTPLLIDSIYVKGFGYRYNPK